MEGQRPEKDTCDGNVEPTHSLHLVSIECPKLVQLVCPDGSQVEVQSPEKDTCDGNFEPIHSSQPAGALVEAQDHKEDTSVV